MIPEYILLCRVIKLANTTGKFFECGEGNIFTNRHYRNDAVALSVFGYHRNPLGDGLLTVTNIYLFAVNINFPFPLSGPHTKQALNSLGTSGTNESGDTQYFATFQGKRDIINSFNMTINRMPCRQMFNT